MTPADREKAKTKEQAARESVKQTKIDHLQSEIEVRARLAGICRQTMLNMVKTGRFPAPMHIGSKKYWRSSIVDAWLVAAQPIDQMAA